MSGNCHQKRYPDVKIHVLFVPRKGRYWNSVFNQYRLTNYTRWWFQTFFMFIPSCGRFPFRLIFFKWVETTNQYSVFHLTKLWTYLRLQFSIPTVGVQLSFGILGVFWGDYQFHPLFRIEPWKKTLVGSRIWLDDYCLQPSIISRIWNPRNIAESLVINQHQLKCHKFFC